MAKCKACGRGLITTVAGGRCVFCGRKKSVFQLGETTLTRRGAQKAGRKQIIANAKKARRGAQKAAQRQVTASANKTPVMSWQEAEACVCEWMKKNGHRDARLTGAGADGGVDVVSRKAVAQVKHHVSPIGLREVQRIYGIARAERKSPMIFATAGFTSAALTWARQHDVQCWRFLPFSRVR